MLLCSVYMIILHAHNSFSSLLTLNVSCCNWSSLGIIEEMIKSQGRLTLLFMSKARTIILPAISVGIESLFRSFVQVCIMTTSKFGFFFISSFVQCFISLVFAPGKQLMDALVNFNFSLIFHLLNTFHHRIANYQSFSELSSFLVYSHCCLFDLEQQHLFLIVISCLQSCC